MRSLSFFGLGLLGLLACGQTQPSSSEVTLDSSVVKSQSSALAAAATAAENDEGTTVSSQIGSIGNNIASLLPRTANGAKGRSSSPIATGGSVSWSDGKITCTDLTFDVKDLGTTVIDGESLKIGASHVAVTCSFTYGKGTLAGSLHATGSTTVNDVAYTWDATMTATDVTFTAREFTAGTVAVDATITTSSETDGSESFHAVGSVTFP